METEKLFYKDPFLTEFTATVLDCQPGKNGYIVTLDRTAFYPEGGGQPADHGTLDGIAGRTFMKKAAWFSTMWKPPWKLGKPWWEASIGRGGSTICSSTPGSTSAPG